MPAIKYKVELTPSQRSDLIEVSRRGKPLARTVKRALALLKADEGLSDREAAEAVSVSALTVARARRRFVDEGLEAAINDRPRPGRERIAERQAGSAPGCHRVQQSARRTCKLDAPSAGGQGVWSWSLPGASPWRRCARYSKKRTQAVEEERVVHPQGERGVRGPDGRSCWTCTTKSTTRSVRWCVLTRPPSSCSGT